MYLTPCCLTQTILRDDSDWRKYFLPAINTTTLCSLLTPSISLQVSLRYFFSLLYDLFYFYFFPFLTWLWKSPSEAPHLCHKTVSMPSTKSLYQAMPCCQLLPIWPQTQKGKSFSNENPGISTSVSYWNISCWAWRDFPEVTEWVSGTAANTNCHWFLGLPHPCHVQIPQKSSLLKPPGVWARRMHRHTGPRKIEKHCRSHPQVGKVFLSVQVVWRLHPRAGCSGSFWSWAHCLEISVDICTYI